LFLDLFEHQICDLPTSNHKKFLAKVKLLQEEGV